MAKHVSFVVLNWQQPQLTINCLNSLLAQKIKNIRLSIVLVDNGSADNSLSLFKKHFSSNKSVTLVSNDKNLGYVQGNNIGLKTALLGQPDYVVILNNDTQVDPLFLKPLLDFSRLKRDQYLLGPKIYFAPGYEYQKNYPKNDIGKIIWSLGGVVDWQNLYGSNLHIDQVDHGQFAKPLTKIDFISGCCLFIPAPILSRLSSFDPKYFLYLEDADYCMQVRKLGFKLAVVPQSVIWHFNSGSSGAASNLHHYFLSRNRLLFGYRWAPFRTKLGLFRQSLSYLLRPPSPYHRQAIIDYYLGRLGQGSWPLN